MIYVPGPGIFWLFLKLFLLDLPNKPNLEFIYFELKYLPCPLIACFVSQTSNFILLSVLYFLNLGKGKNFVFILFLYYEQNNDASLPIVGFKLYLPGPIDGLFSFNNFVLILNENYFILLSSKSDFNLY